MQKFQILFIMFIAASTAFAQQISYNHIANPDNDEVKEVIALFENYLNSDPAKQEKNVFWNQAVQDKFKKYDFLESEFQPSLYMGFPVHVLSIKSQGGTYEIKAQFAFCKENGEPYILAIVNYYVKKENGAFKLYNALTLNRESWKHKNVGMVDFYYPPYHEFDFAKAEKLNEFIVEMCSDLKVEPKPFEYYLADDYDEIQSLKGIDYYLGMGGESIPSGKSAEGKVYCGGMGENYFHEVFHVEIDAYYPNKHPWISEGMATFLGGSRGKDLDWHIERTNEHLKNHPEINLNNMLVLTNLDTYTSYHYVLGGLICKKIYEKGGWPMLMEFMQSGKSDEDYYAALEKYLGVSQNELNSFLREALNNNEVE